MKCPICEKENNSTPINNWNFTIYEVSRYKCLECGEKFNAYMSNGKIVFTVPKTL